jgi:hypothetical protein
MIHRQRNVIAGDKVARGAIWSGGLLSGRLSAPPGNATRSRARGKTGIAYAKLPYFLETLYGMQRY